MKEFTGKNNILWDFDGVLMDSMPIRDQGFYEVLKKYPRTEVEELMNFHRKNGGLSRYVKFRYFFEEVRKEKVSEAEVKNWAYRFSVVMRKNLIKDDLIIKDSMEFVRNNHEHFKMHIVSGSDQEELRYLCKENNIASFFNSIHGSPTPKISLVEQVIKKNGYKKEETILIGDSVNDYEAAKKNDIQFFGYNNTDLKILDAGYIKSFQAC